jgi:acetyl esterase/lipase
LQIQRVHNTVLNMVTRERISFILWLFMASRTVFAAEVRPTHRDLEYARVDGHRLLLDLYLPREVANAPLIVWIHGGAWRAGSKDAMPLGRLVEHGFAVASIDYRLTPVARFPANIHDIKAAVRWLRSQSSRFGYNSEGIGISGASAGGHLANLVGVSNGHSALEGTVGGHLDQSSDVQAVVSFYGAANLTTILGQSTPHGLRVRVPALDLLLGGQPDQMTRLAELASPVFHVDRSDPPLLMYHGDQDPQMPVNQSIELLGRYRAAGLDGTLRFVHGATHGGAGFYNEDRLREMEDFLRRHLK